MLNKSIHTPCTCDTYSTRRPWGQSLYSHSQLAPSSRHARSWYKARGMQVTTDECPASNVQPYQGGRAGSIPEHGCSASGNSSHCLALQPPHTISHRHESSRTRTHTHAHSCLGYLNPNTHPTYSRQSNHPLCNTSKHARLAGHTSVHSTHPWMAAPVLPSTPREWQTGRDWSMAVNSPVRGIIGDIACMCLLQS